MAQRLKAMGVSGYENGFRLSIIEDRINQPLKRKTPTTYFVNSMSDLFHEEITDDFLDRIFSVISNTPYHTYQILTKRAERLPEYFGSREVPQNVWLGVSVEDRKYGVPRIDLLRQVNASVRFLSAEPLLADLGPLDLNGIHWVIVGGESGPKARPMRSNWVEKIRSQCEAQGVAFFFKQWGGWGADGKKRAKSKNGRKYLGKTWNEMPEKHHRGVNYKDD